MANKNLVYSFSRCSTCRKALGWLDANNISYELLDIITNPPSKEFISKAIAQLGDRKFLFNTSGLSYRSIGSSVVKSFTDSEALDALAADGKLIKRPFFVSQNGLILVGFKQDIWETSLIG